MNILITADEKFGDYVFLRRKMNSLTRNFTHDPCIVTVQEKPIRQLVEKWVTERFLFMQICHSDKDKHGKEADAKRDEEAFAHLTTDFATHEPCKGIVVIFTTGSGSEHLKRITQIAEKKGIKVRRILYEDDE